MKTDAGANRVPRGFHQARCRAARVLQDRPRCRTRRTPMQPTARRRCRLLRSRSRRRLPPAQKHSDTGHDACRHQSPPAASVPWLLPLNDRAPPERRPTKSATTARTFNPMKSNFATPTALAAIPVKPKNAVKNRHGPSKHGVPSFLLGVILAFLPRIARGEGESCRARADLSVHRAAVWRWHERCFLDGHEPESRDSKHDSCCPHRWVTGVAGMFNLQRLRPRRYQ